MKTCQEISQLASRACDEKIGLLQTAELTLHLMMCQNCRNFYENNKKLSEILKEHKNTHRHSHIEH
ncbi:hypothetical protein [Moraxella oblonga]|uniref:anti-sigma factor family protein n=1 Tax=Moraxella oblonga TaxID=200413 RepID=UPI000831FD1B|nr:hypothetical protein [Moraxella oblonga]